MLKLSPSGEKSNMSKMDSAVQSKSSSSKASSLHKKLKPKSPREAKVLRAETASHSAEEYLLTPSSDSKEQMRQLLFTVKAIRRGEFSVRMPTGHDGIISEIGEVLND